MSPVSPFGRVLSLCVSAATVSVMAGCASATPIRTPIEMGPVSEGPNTLAFARQQLQGTWTLTKLEVLNAAGQMQAVRAKAQLVYDEFANLSMKGVLEEPLPGQTTITDAPALVYSGRAVIDTEKHELVLQGVDASVKADPSIEAAIKLSARRRYQIEGATLTIWVVDALGKTTFRATYMK